MSYSGASQVALEVKNSPANAGDVRDAGSIPGGGGKGFCKNDHMLIVKSVKVLNNIKIHIKIIPSTVTYLFIFTF